MKGIIEKPEGKETDDNPETGIVFYRFPRGAKNPNKKRRAQQDADDPGFYQHGQAVVMRRSRSHAEAESVVRRRYYRIVDAGIERPITADAVPGQARARKGVEIKRNPVSDVDMIGAENQNISDENRCHRTGREGTPQRPALPQPYTAEYAAGGYGGA